MTMMLTGRTVRAARPNRSASWIGHQERHVRAPSGRHRRGPEPRGADRGAALQLGPARTLLAKRMRAEAMKRRGATAILSPMR